MVDVTFVSINFWWNMPPLKTIRVDRTAKLVSGNHIIFYSVGKLGEKRTFIAVTIENRVVQNHPCCYFEMY